MINQSLQFLKNTWVHFTITPIYIIFHYFSFCYNYTKPLRECNCELILYVVINQQLGNDIR